MVLWLHIDHASLSSVGYELQEELSHVFTVTDIKMSSTDSQNIFNHTQSKQLTTGTATPL